MNLKKILFWIIIIANVLGILYGVIFFYSTALMQAISMGELWKVLFIPDSPMSTFFITLSLILIFFGFEKKLNLIHLLAFALAVKYGFWSVFVLAFYSSTYLTQGIELYSVLFLAHIGLFLEAFLLISKVEVKKWMIAVVLILLLVNDVSDYFFGTHPPLPENSLQFMFLFTGVISILVTAFAYAVLTLKKTPILDLIDQK